MENGSKVEALRLTNCRVGKQEAFEDPDEIYVRVDVIRSKLSVDELEREDVDNHMLDLGLCTACAGRAAYLYDLRSAVRGNRA